MLNAQDRNRALDHERERSRGSAMMVRAVRIVK